MLIWKSNYRVRFLPGELTNSFYLDILKSWEHVSESLHQNIDFVNQVIWNNKNMLVNGKTIFYMDFCNAGIVFVSDLLNNEDKLLSWEVMKDRYKITNWIQYNALSKLINTANLPLENLNHYSMRQFKAEDIKPERVKDILLKNVCSHPDVQFFLSELYSHQQIEYIYKMPFKLPLLPRVRMFKYYYIHKKIYTKVLLKKMKIVHDDLCPFCSQVQTFKHMFLECEKVALFWTQVQSLLEDVLNTNIILDGDVVLYAYFGEFSDEINTVLVIAQYFIYIESKKESIPTFRFFYYSYLYNYIKTKLVGKMKPLATLFWESLSTRMGIA